MGSEMCIRDRPLLPNEDQIWEMYTTNLETLKLNGYGRYEISAFSLPNKECKHNLNYWQFGDYLGLGAGAHGKRSSNDLDGYAEQPIRVSKASQPRLYLADPRASTERSIDAEAMVVEFMMNALRLVDGVESVSYTHLTLPTMFEV